MDLVTRYCPDCGEDRLFSPPHDVGGCPDAIDDLAGECPELACTDCGLALVIAFTPGGRLPDRAPVRSGASTGSGTIEDAETGPASAPRARQLGAVHSRHAERAA